MNLKYETSELLVSVKAFISESGLDKTYWIAYSGGLDSQVLLSLLSQIRYELPIQIKAIHINHGLSPHAKAWDNFCKTQCETWDIPFVVHSIELHKQTGESLEALARDMRYHIFSKEIGADVLLTAHHQDDQAETVLLQLLRGAGLKGLASMPITKTMGLGLHSRPLLSFPRTTLEAYAKAHQLKWIEDESNENTQFSRNFIRHEILPILKKRWPTATNMIARSGSHCAEAQVVLEALTADLCKTMHGSGANTLSVAKLLELNPEKQRLVLRAFIGDAGATLPDVKKMERILKNVLTAKWDKLPYVRWGEVTLRRYRDDLFIIKSLPQHDNNQVHSWDLKQNLILAGIGSLSAELEIGKGLSPVLSALTVRFRQGGEKIDLPGRCRRTLKNLFHEWNVLPWERDRIPLFFMEEKLIGVLGYYWDKNLLVHPEEKGWVVRVFPHPAPLALPKAG